MLTVEPDVLCEHRVFRGSRSAIRCFWDVWTGPHVVNYTDDWLRWRRSTGTMFLFLLCWQIRYWSEDLLHWAIWRQPAEAMFISWPGNSWAQRAEAAGVLAVFVFRGSTQPATLTTHTHGRWNKHWIVAWFEMICMLRSECSHCVFKL